MEIQKAAGLIVSDRLPFSMVPEAGLEPARCCHRQILSLVRLPFRHSGISVIILSYGIMYRQ
jgi:hypothetical protein